MSFIGFATAKVILLRATTCIDTESTREVDRIVQNSLPSERSEDKYHTWIHKNARKKMVCTIVSGPGQGGMSRRKFHSTMSSRFGNLYHLKPAPYPVLLQDVSSVKVVILVPYQVYIVRRGTA